MTRDQHFSRKSIRGIMVGGVLACSTFGLLLWKQQKFAPRILISKGAGEDLGNVLPASTGEQAVIENLDFALKDSKNFDQYEIHMGYAVSGSHFLKYDRNSEILSYCREDIKPITWKTYSDVSPQRIHEVASKSGSLKMFEVSSN